MLCPNCDSILNAIGCQACGWKYGQLHTRDERVFPFRANAEYPEATRGVVRFANRPDVPDLPHHEEELEPPPPPVPAPAPETRPETRPTPKRPSDSKVTVQ
jgi:hypothetical protein